MFIPHYPATSTYFPPLSRFSLNIIRSGKVKEVKGALGTLTLMDFGTYTG